MRSAFTLLIALLPKAFAATYALSDNYVGTDFLSAFVHEAIADPSQGRVNYVTQATALADNLTYATGDTLVMRADHKTVLDPSGPGRNSVRIRSLKTYTEHVIVFDIRHMPQGCGTWPAAWEVNGTAWPAGGEVDIVEGVNNQSPNQMTLHTSPGCTMPASRGMTGTAGNNDCEGADGCGVRAPTADSYGPAFNAIGGGWYAMERTQDFIKMWFFPRDAASPSDVSGGARSVDTDSWPEPTAYFPNTQCDIARSFDGNNIVINLDFCGQWAGVSSVYASSGCPSTCVDYVNNNPSAFVDAYWDIAAVRTYEPPAGAAPPPAPPASGNAVHPNGDTSKCLEVEGGVFANGTPVQIHDCTGSASQSWVVNEGATAVQVAGTSYCLDAGSSPANGTQMKIWECYPDLAAQTWFYTSDARIALRNQGQCLDLTNGAKTEGNVMQIWACTDGDVYQIWTLS